MQYAMKVWFGGLLSPASRLFWWVVLLGICLTAAGNKTTAADGDPERGWQLLLSKGYLPADLDQEVFDALWTIWPEPLRSRAEQAGPEERRRLARERYGLLPHPEDPSRTVQYAVDAAGKWTMSCLACHQGQVAGRLVPGLPNSNYALETLTADVRMVKLAQQKALGHMDIGSLLLPLGTTNGTTNAVIFGVALMHHRDAELNIVSRPPRFDLIHHDMDAPPWWHYAKRKTLYADGFAPQGHRMLMQFLLVKENGPEKFREWEDDFRHIEAWIESLKPPAWPGPIDHQLAEQGRGIFCDHCSSCHGTYGPGGKYPETVVSIAEIGTDRVRFDALTNRERLALNDSWFGHFGEDAEPLGDRQRPAGYVAPPLDGIWATAPYFHNGSVPTLWHLLRPAQRPEVWRRTPAGYDDRSVGLEVETLTTADWATQLAAGLPADQRRQVFDTTRPGKSATGHDYPAVLSEAERTALLEYLKSL
jgi:mono/diheme cytochrome c family protein